MLLHLLTPAPVSSPIPDTAAMLDRTLSLMCMATTIANLPLDQVAHLVP